MKALKYYFVFFRRWRSLVSFSFWTRFVCVRRLFRWKVIRLSMSMQMLVRLPSDLQFATMRRRFKSKVWIFYPCRAPVFVSIVKITVERFHPINIFQWYVFVTNFSSSSISVNTAKKIHCATASCIHTFNMNFPRPNIRGKYIFLSHRTSKGFEIVWNISIPIRSETSETLKKKMKLKRDCC